MQSVRLGKYEIWHENSDEFYELKKEIFSENCYYLELDTEAPLIIDAGAHIGMSVLYFKMLFPKARIVAYEPVPANFALLTKNVEENQLDNVTLIQGALAPKSGKLILQEPVEMQAWKSGAGIIPKGWKGIQTSSEIVTTAIGVDEALAQPVDLLKMDIEGMEYEVIRSAGTRLTQVHTLIVEVHPRKGHLRSEIEKVLLQNKFTLDIRDDESHLGRGLTTITAVHT